MTAQSLAARQCPIILFSCVQRWKSDYIVFLCPALDTGKQCNRSCSAARSRKNADSTGFACDARAADLLEAEELKDDAQSQHCTDLVDLSRLASQSGVVEYISRGEA
eukprot:SAG31_NODE_1319_length_8817_cov_1.857077_9_plen_107_part_00